VVSRPTTTQPCRPPVPVTHAPTRATAAWFATAAALVLLVLLLILILQNQNDVRVHYLGLAGSISLGMALLSAAVAGAAVVTIVGLIRLTQVRFSSRRRLHSKVECEGQPWTHVGRDADEHCPTQSGGGFSCAPVCRG
jgi:uncharacterized integral membrane protein